MFQAITPLRPVALPHPLAEAPKEPDGPRGYDAPPTETVLAADLVSLLGAIVLYFFSIGPVRGFALFLGISTVLDVIVTYTFTRPFVILLGRSRGATEAKTMGVASGLGIHAEADR